MSFLTEPSLQLSMQLFVQVRTATVRGGSLSLYSASRKFGIGVVPCANVPAL
jgi:hypothetical protein